MPLIFQRTTSFFRWTLFALFGSSFGVLMAHYVVRYHYHTTLRPLMDHYRWDKSTSASTAGQTYYPRICSKEDITTTDVLRDLVVHPNWSASTTVENILMHGASIFPNLVDPQVADEFRNYTLIRNANIQNNNFDVRLSVDASGKRTRWSFAIDPRDHASIPVLLRQVVSNDSFRDALESLLGPNPAIIGMRTITSGFGAKVQGWHPDVWPTASQLSHARDFVPHYRLFIPLQDVSLDMGATGICPGSHYCSHVDRAGTRRCREIVTGTRETNGNTERIWKTGDAALLSQNTFHRGPSHVLKDGPDRALVVLTFAPRPRLSSTTRDTMTGAKTTSLGMFLPTIKGSSSSSDEQEETSYYTQRNNQVETKRLAPGTPPSSFGHTLNDLWNATNTMSTTWTTLRHYGIYKQENAEWGWDLTSSIFSSIATEAVGFQANNLAKWLDTPEKWGWFMWLYMTYLASDEVPIPEDRRSIWDVWLAASLERAMYQLQKITICCLLVSFLLLRFGGVITRSKGERTVPSYNHPPSLRLFGICVAVIVAVSTLLHMVLQQSSLVQEVRTGEKIRPSFPTGPTERGIAKLSMYRHSPWTGIVTGISSSNIMGHDWLAVPAVEPDRKDILIATRLDSLHLGVINRHFEFHSGNVEWRRQVQKYGALLGNSMGISSSSSSSSWASVPKVLQDVMIEEIQQTVQERKFLVQIPSTGTFGELSPAATRVFIGNTLAKECSPPLRYLDESISFLVAYWRYESKIRTSAMANFGIIELEWLRTKLLRGIIATGLEGTASSSELQSVVLSTAKS